MRRFVSRRVPKGFHRGVVGQSRGFSDEGFVGGVEPRALTKLDLLEIVSSFGALTAFRCGTDGAGLCRGFAWMEYAEGESVAAKAIAGLSEYQLGVSRSRRRWRRRAEAARTRGERRYTYEVPPEVEPLLKPPQRVLAFSTSLFEVGRGKTERRRGGYPRRCAEFGNVLSTHVVDEGAEGAEELDAVRDCLFVEFARVETATIAAHAFHRREYDGRVVECRFFPLTEYQRMFGKGFPPRTVGKAGGGVEDDGLFGGHRWVRDRQAGGVETGGRETGAAEKGRRF